MIERLKAAKTAFKEPEKMTVSLPVIEMSESPGMFRPRNFDEEYAERGYTIRRDQIAAFSKKHLGYEISPDAIGFMMTAGLVATRVYEAGLKGNPITDVIPWLYRNEEDAERNPIDKTISAK